MRSEEEIRERLSCNMTGYTKEGIRCVYDRYETMCVERNILEWVLADKEEAKLRANF